MHEGSDTVVVWREIYQVVSAKMEVVRAHGSSLGIEVTWKVGKVVEALRRGRGQEGVRPDARALLPRLLPK